MLLKSIVLFEISCLLYVNITFVEWEHALFCFMLIWLLLNGSIVLYLNTACLQSHQEENLLVHFLPAICIPHVHDPYERLSELWF